MAKSRTTKKPTKKSQQGLVYPVKKQVPTVAVLPPCECDPFAGWAPGILIKTASGMMVLQPPPGNSGSYTLKWVNGNYVWVNDN